MTDSVNYTPYLLRGSIHKNIIVGLLVFTVVWSLWMLSASKDEKAESSIEGIVNHIQTNWATVETITGVKYVPEVTVDFIKPQKSVELRAIFVTDSGDYWGDAQTLIMDNNLWESQSSVTVQGSRGLQNEGDLVAFQEQRVPPIKVWIFDKNSDQSEPLIKLPVIH